MSQSNGYRTTTSYPQGATVSGAGGTGGGGSPARSSSYRPCHSALPTRLFASNALSSRPFDMENRSSLWTNARNNLSVGEEFQHQGKIDSSYPTQAAAPHYIKYLEEKMANIQEQHQNTVVENTNLNNQLLKVTARNRELEERVAALEEALLQEKCPAKSSYATLQRGTNTLGTESSDASTSTDNPHRQDQTAQTTNPELKSSAPDSSPDFISISKCELESLEADMRALRDLVRAKEELWDEVADRERNYREHLARLSIELVTARQLADSRYNEMQTFIHRLTEQKEELLITQKELALAKKTLMKFTKNESLSDETINETSTSVLNTSDSLESQAKQQRRTRDGRPNSQPVNPLAKHKSRASPSPRDVRASQQRHSPREHAAPPSRAKTPLLTR